MKKIALMAALCAVFSFSTPAQEPELAARHGHVYRFARYVSGHFLGVFTDLKDPEWAAAFTLDTLAQSADTASTCYGMGQGFVEAGMIGHGSRSCPKVAAAQFGVHFLKWTATHAVWKEMVKQCRHDATQGTHKAWWEGKNPESCKHALWIGDLTVPAHINNTYSNVCLLQGGCVVKPKVPLGH